MEQRTKDEQIDFWIKLHVKKNELIKDLEKTISVQNKTIKLQNEIIAELNNGR